MQRLQSIVHVLQGGSTLVTIADGVECGRGSSFRDCALCQSGTFFVDSATSIRYCGGAIGSASSSTSIGCGPLIVTLCQVIGKQCSNSQCVENGNSQSTVPTPTPTSFQPTSRTSVPSGAKLLTGGRGLTNGVPQTDGNFQVEWYCNSRGYVPRVTRDKKDWYCENPKTGRSVFTIIPDQFDSICRQTYANKSTIFAFQSGTGPEPAYNWRCYDIGE